MEPDGLVVAAERHQPPHGVDVLERPPGPDDDAVQRLVGDSDRHAGLVREPLREAAEQRSATGQRDAVFHDVGGKFRRRLVERRLDSVDDRADRLGERLADVLGRELDRARQTGHEVAAADVGGELFLQWPCRAHLDLDLLGRAVTDRQRVLLLDVLQHSVVEFVAGDADRLRRDDAAQRDHGHLGGAAADVDDHVAARLVDRQIGADRGSHRLFDDVDRLAGAGVLGSVLHRALLDAGDAGRHTDDHAWLGPLAGVHLLDEVAQHLLAHFEVGDDTVFQRTDRLDVVGCATHHALGFDADRDRSTIVDVDCHDRRLVEHDAEPAGVDQSVGGAEVDREVATQTQRVTACHVDLLSNDRSVDAGAGTAPASHTPVMLQIREEDADLAFGAGERVAAVHEVLGEQDAEVSTDRSRGCGAGVGGAHHRANDFPGVLGALDHHGDDGTTAHELDEVAVEALADMFFVVASQRVGVEPTQFHGDDVEVLGLEAGDDLADELALDRVGLEQDERAIRHGTQGYRKAPIGRSPDSGPQAR